MTAQPEHALDAARRLLADNDKLRDELQAARRQIEATQRQLQSSQSEARTDPLSGLRNRRAFDEELNRLLAQRQRQGTALSVLLIDADHFKSINDDYGHQVGDAVLRRLAEVFVATLREMDFVCRYGGEEFAVLCPGSELVAAGAAAARVREAVALHEITTEAKPLRITVSIGVAEAQDGDVAEDLIARADAALYAAKQAGRDRVVLHNGQTCVTT